MDLIIFNLINQFAGRWPVLDVVGIFFARYIGYILVLVVLLFLLKNFKKYWPMVAKVFIAAILSRFIITELIRFLWYRARPYVENNVNLLLPHDPVNNPVASFPSGHAAFYFAIATIVYFYNKKLGILFFIASFLMGIARVFGGVHWPSDILAGAIVGIISAWLVVKLSKRFFRSRIN